MSNVIGIDEYQARIMKLAAETIPKETKAFLKTETQKFRRRLISRAKQVVPRSKIGADGGEESGKEHRKYHDSFKSGKTYKYNSSFAKRVFNRSRHGRYVEYGRRVAKGYERGDSYKHAQRIGTSKHYDVYKVVKPAFEPVYISDCEEWTTKMLKEGKL